MLDQIVGQPAYAAGDYPDVKMAAVAIGEFWDRQGFEIVDLHRRVGELEAWDRPRRIDQDAAHSVAGDGKRMEVFDRATHDVIEVAAAACAMLSDVQYPAGREFPV